MNFISNFYLDKIYTYIEYENLFWLISFISFVINITIYNRRNKYKICPSLFYWLISGFINAISLMILLHYYFNKVCLSFIY